MVGHGAPSMPEVSQSAFQKQRSSSWNSTTYRNHRLICVVSGQEGNCHSTTGAKYAISLVHTYQMTAEPISSIIKPFQDGVTPILTVFYRPNSTTANTSGQLKDPEFHLNCLRPVGHSLDSHTVQGSLATSFRPELGMAAVAVLVASTLLC
jgi:hypothetical protein